MSNKELPPDLKYRISNIFAISLNILGTLLILCGAYIFWFIEVSSQPKDAISLDIVTKVTVALGIYALVGSVVSGLTMIAMGQLIRLLIDMVRNQHEQTSLQKQLLDHLTEVRQLSQIKPT
jgi:hypothetical protein